MHSVYSRGFGMRPPYQLLVDDTFCLAALRHKFDLRERLPIVMGAPVRLLVTACTMTAMREAAKGAVDPVITGAPFVGRRLELRRCRHDQPLEVSQCIRELIGKDNLHHYGVASNCDQLKDAIRKVPGVPIIFIERTFPLLETPSKLTMATLAKREEAKRHISTTEAAIIKKEFGELSDQTITSKHKKRKAKGPNPLSIRKSTKGRGPGTGPSPGTGSSSGSSSGTGTGPKRKRRNRSLVKALDKGMGYCNVAEP